MQSMRSIPKLSSLVYSVFEGTCARSPLNIYSVSALRSSLFDMILIKASTFMQHLYCSDKTVVESRRRLKPGISGLLRE